MALRRRAAIIVIANRTTVLLLVWFLMLGRVLPPHLMVLGLALCSQPRIGLMGFPGLGSRYFQWCKSNTWRSGLVLGVPPRSHVCRYGNVLVRGARVQAGLLSCFF